MNTRLNKLVFAVALLSGIAATPVFAQSSMAPNSDAALVEQVKAALAQARPLTEADVDIAVTASNGVVKLSGWVTYTDDIKLAEKIAASVNGVKGVVDGSFHTWSSQERGNS